VKLICRLFSCTIVEGLDGFRSRTGSKKWYGLEFLGPWNGKLAGGEFRFEMEIVENVGLLSGQDIE